MARYNIYYHQYNIIARDYIPHVRVVETEDIYHEIGKMICNAFAEIKKIRYTHPKTTYEECVAMWEKDGYVKVSSNTWWLENPKKKDVEFEQATEPILIEPKNLVEKCKYCIHNTVCQEQNTVSDCVNYKDKNMFVELHSETEALLIEAYRKIGSTIYWTEFNENDESFRKNGPRMYSEVVRSIDVFGDSIHLMDEFGSIVEDMKKVGFRYTEDKNLSFFYSFSRSDIEKAIDAYWEDWVKNL